MVEAKLTTPGGKQQEHSSDRGSDREQGLGSREMHPEFMADSDASPACASRLSRKSCLVDFGYLASRRARPNRVWFQHAGAAPVRPATSYAAQPTVRDTRRPREPQRR